MPPYLRFRQTGFPFINLSLDLEQLLGKDLDLDLDLGMGLDLGDSVGVASIQSGSVFMEIA